MYLALKTKSDSGLFQRLFYWLTKWRLLTEYPHAGIVQDGLLFHSNLENGLHAVQFDPHGWVLLPVPDLHNARDLFEFHRGTDYDWFSLLGFVLPWQVRDGDRMYCYEWCWLAMTGKVHPGRVTPEMLLALVHRLRSEQGVPDATNA